MTDNMFIIMRFTLIPLSGLLFTLEMWSINGMHHSKLMTGPRAEWRSICSAAKLLASTFVPALLDWRGFWTIVILDVASIIIIIKEQKAIKQLEHNDNT